MFLHVKEARYLHDYVVWLRFNDGAVGELEGEMFAPLKNKDDFVKFHVDPDIETIVWDNGADFAPEFLYDNMKILA